MIAIQKTMLWINLKILAHTPAAFLIFFFRGGVKKQIKTKYIFLKEIQMKSQESILPFEIGTDLVIEQMLSPCLIHFFYCRIKYAVKDCIHPINLTEILRKHTFLMT